MEAVGGGASVLAFVGLAAQSAKTLYELFSALKDAPQDVERVATHVHQFQSVLGQLSQSRAFSESAPEVTRDVGQHVKICNDEIEAISAKLKGLRISDHEKQSGIFWKRVKYAFKEKSLRQMGNIIGRHTNLLTLRLSTIHSNVIYGSADRLVSIDQKAVQQIAMSTEHYLQAQQQSSTLSSLRNDMGNLRNDCVSIGREISNMSSLSSSHATQVMDILQQLKDKVGRIESNQQSTAKGKGHEDDNDDLYQAIERLSSLVNEKACTLDDAVSEDITDDIQKLLTHLRILSQQEHSNADVGDHFGRPQWSAQDLRKDLKTMEGLTIVSREIALNKPSPSLSYQGSLIIQNTKKRKAFDIAGGTLTITGTKRRFVTFSDDDNAPSEKKDDFIATMSFMPKRSTSNKMFTLSVQSRGRTSSIPRFSVNCVLPAESPVFDLVRGGHMQEFLQMLQSGTASIRDHDEYGASLLHYAVTGRQPEMLKLLVDHGLDANYVGDMRYLVFLRLGKTEGYFLETADIGTAICAEITDDIDCDEYELESANECRRILLDAGCDPTTAMDRDGYTNLTFLWAQVFFTGAIETMRIFFNHSAPFFSLETKIDASGSTPLLSLCGGTFARIDKIQFLLNRGADVHARDKNGKSCLHLIYASAVHKTGKREIISFLIDSGADIFARDFNDESVSEARYSKDGQSLLGSPGSSDGDIWDNVLARQGYNIAEFRKGWPRVAKYVTGDSWWYNNYEREDFESLWEGMEHLCPYYHMPEGKAYHFGNWIHPRCKEVFEEEGAVYHDFGVEENEDKDLDQDSEGDDDEDQGSGEDDDEDQTGDTNDEDPDRRNLEYGE